MEGIKTGTMHRCVIITEANEKVASGHLMEIAELTALLKRENIDTITLVNDDASPGLKKRIQGTLEEYKSDVTISTLQIVDIINNSNCNVIVTDLRKVENSWLHHIKSATKKTIICIDELGRRRLDCDVIINPMIDPYFWDYEDSNATIYHGNEYLILPLKIQSYHSKDKIINRKIKKVCISMGGVDYYGTTNTLLSILPTHFPDINWEVVLGASFRQKDQLNEILKGNSNNVTLYQNIDFIYDIFSDADIAFCAGGNTLHELACIGTPTIVIPTMPHEINNGKMFEKNGFGICLDLSTNVTIDNILSSFNKLMNDRLRQNMSLKGKLISDGNGGSKNVNIIKKYGGYDEGLS